MELFVYNWIYTGYTLYGHCLDDEGNYRQLEVTDFLPSCFIEGDTVPSSTVVPVKVKYKRMLSSVDISSLRPFNRLYFKNKKNMDEFKTTKKYMADIPQVTMFLSQIGADHVGWVRVASSSAVNNSSITANEDFGNTLHPVESFHSNLSGDSTRQSKRQNKSFTQCRMSDIVNVPDKLPPSLVKVLSFDIEVRSMDSGMPKPHRMQDTVEMISVVTNDKTFLFHTTPGLEHTCAESIECNDEIDMITRFFTLIKSEDPTIITGYNIYGFDLHYLVSRMKLRLVEIPDISRGATESVDVIRVDWSSNAYGNNDYDRLVIGGRVILDMYLYFKRMKLDKYSLEFVSHKFIGEGKDDMPYAKMARAFDSGDLEVLAEVARYCIKDSALVYRLFDKVKMWIDSCEIAKITNCSIEDIYTRGEQMKMVSQCVAECAKRNIVLQHLVQTSWSPYEGAYVLEPEKGVYNDCSILDFQSLYPSIIIAYNICPSTYVTAARAAAVDTFEVGNHFFRKHPVGLLPGMIKKLLEERHVLKTTMKAMDDKTTVEYIVHDRRQNALKICANSVYGMMGFKYSRYFGHRGCAESVTTVGRELLNDIVDKIEKSYPVTVVYGDSVAGYTPTIIRVHEKSIFIETLENLAKWGGSGPLRSNWIQCDGKESCELDNVEVWTDDGWTKCTRVIRHMLSPSKKMMRVLTHTGLVDVTNDHSLLYANKTPTSANDIKIGDMLLHESYPSLEDRFCGILPNEARILGMFCGDGSCDIYNCPSGTKATWAINNANPFLLIQYKKLCEDVYSDDFSWTILDTRKSSGVFKLAPKSQSYGRLKEINKRYRWLLYANKVKVVPQQILNSNFETRQAFWDGLYDADGDKDASGCKRIDQKSQLSIASFAMLASSIGYKVSLNTRHDKPNIFRLTVTKNIQRKHASAAEPEAFAVKKIHEIDYTGYVYDITTHNNHFQAGPGQMIVHNTDSVLLWHNSTSHNPAVANKYDSVCNTALQNVSLAESICHDVTASLPVPMALKFETYCEKVILLTKKRYILVSNDKITYKGVMNARRDYCAYAKQTYSNTMEMVAKGTTNAEIADYIDKRIFKLIAGKVDMQELVVTKSVARKLSTYKVNAPHVVLAKRLQKTGIDIPAGTRLEYIYIQNSDIKMVTPEEFTQGCRADGRFYVEKQLATQIDDVLSVIGMGKYIKNTWL